MNPLLVIAIPLVLVIVGMILNAIGRRSDEPGHIQEQDPRKRLEAERDAYRKSYQHQKSQSFKRQKRVGQYAWLILFAFAASHLWMYFDTVDRTTAWNQIAALQTVVTGEATEEGKRMVLSVTRSDGSNVKYLIKLTPAESSDTSATRRFSPERISSWELAGAKTALSIGENPLPAGVALKIAN